MKPGATVERGELELSAIAARLAKEYPAENADWPAVSPPLSLRSELLGNVRSRLTFLAVAMALVLLIGWINVTNLSLVRASTRTRELAIRTSRRFARTRRAPAAVRATGDRHRQAFVIGSFAATSVLALVRGFGSGTPGSDAVAINGRALAFAAIVSVLSALVIGALPVFRALSSSLTEPLREGSSGGGFGRQQQRARSLLVVGEIALALMLVIAAGLLVKSFWRLSSVDPGFNTHLLVAIDLSPPGRRYAQPSQTGAFYTSLLDAVRAVPGVDGAALTNHMPLNGAALPVSVQISGRAPDPDHDPQVLFRTISPEYVGTLGIPVRQGRNFTASGTWTSGTAVLRQRAFRRRRSGSGADPIGKGVMLHKSAQNFDDLGEPLPGVVVGVIGDVHHFGVSSDPVAEIYIPYTRNPWGHMVVVSRVKGVPEAAIPAIRRAILSVDSATNVSGWGGNCWRLRAIEQTFAKKGHVGRSLQHDVAGEFRTLRAAASPAIQGSMV